MDMSADFGLEMKISHREIQVLLLHGFRLDRKATEAKKSIGSEMGEEALSPVLLSSVSIASTEGTLNSSIYLAPKDHVNKHD